MSMRLLLQYLAPITAATIFFDATFANWKNQNADQAQASYAASLPVPCLYLLLYLSMLFLATAQQHAEQTVLLICRLGVSRTSSTQISWIRLDPDNLCHGS